MQCVGTVYIINNKEQFLMMYNKKQGAWLPPGGFVEENELIYECAVRETKEEIGVEISDSLEFIGNVTFNNSDLDSRTELLPNPIFIARQLLTNGKTVENFCYLARTNVDEISEKNYNAMWFNFDEINDIETFKNVKMQMEFIKENLNSFNAFPKVLAKK